MCGVCGCGVGGVLCVCGWGCGVGVVCGVCVWVNVPNASRTVLASRI